MRDVLRASAAELSRSGYAAFRIEEVAVRAGVAKTTVYRRWPTKSALVIATLRSLGPFDQAVPSGGDLEGDLVVLLRRMAAWGKARGRGIVRMMALERGDPEVGAITRQLRQEGKAPYVTLLERAQRRGELPAAADPALVAEILMAAVTGRLRRSGEPADDRFLRRIARLVLDGARSAGSAGKRRTHASRPRRPVSGATTG